MHEDEPYVPPETELWHTLSAREGTLTGALSGDYEIDVGAFLREALWRSRGFKLTCNLAGLIGVFGGMVGSALVEMLLGLDSKAAQGRGDYVAFLGTSLLTTVVLAPLTAPLTAGVMDLGLQGLRGEEPEVLGVFKSFERWVPFTLLFLAQLGALVLGALLLVLPAIYVSVALAFAQLLMVDRRLGPLDALAVSFRSVNQHWFQVAGLFLALGSIGIISTLSLGILFVWTYPLLVLTLCVAYKAMFGLDRRGP